MNDGNTALPVSPVSKEEAMSLSSMFSRAADMIVQASSLPAEIERLQGELNTVKAGYESKSLHAQELDAQLADMRQQRNAAEERARIAEAEASRLAQVEKDNLSLIETHVRAENALREELAQTRRDRDDALMASMQHEDDAAKAHKALKDIQDRVSALFPTPKPEPTPTKPEPDGIDRTAEPATWAEPSPSEPFQGLPPSASPSADPPKYEDQSYSPDLQPYRNW